MKPPRANTGSSIEQYNIAQITKVLGGNVSFGTSTTNNDLSRNINGYFVSGTAPGSANTEFSVAHDIRRIPIGFLVISLDRAAHLYKSTTAWTSTTIYLKSDTASVAYVIFII